ncbi:hypothetical protein Tco_1079068 [Tanacetum coccineum]|uniref:Uncharacterized protein n=1 Tax=Tanacetum coccineum TaxID=301880 RepID=A0ABQ5HR37_9ASTR
MPRECLKIIESKSKVRQTRAKAVVAKVSTNSSTQAVSSDVAELKDIVRALLLDKKNQASAPAPALHLCQSTILTEVLELPLNPCLARIRWNGTLFGGHLETVTQKTWRTRQVPDSFLGELSLPDLTPTCMTLELADRSISRPMGNCKKTIYVKVGVISSFQQTFVVETQGTAPHSSMPFLRGRQQVARQYARELDVEEKPLFIKVLKSHSELSAWKKLSGLQVSTRNFVPTRFLMEEDYAPAVPTSK